MSSEENPPADEHAHENASALLKHLRASEEKFRAAFDQSIMGMVLSDEDGVVLSANQAFCRIVGRRLEEVVGRDSEHMTHPEDQRQNRDQLARIKAKEQDSTTFQKRYVRKDGFVVWTQINVTPLPGTNDEPGTLVATIEDITAEVEARKALLESEQHLRLILESVRDYAIMTVDPEGRVTAWNSGAQQVFGYSVDEILGKDSAILWTPEDRDRDAPAYERNQAIQKGSWEGERYQQRKDGSRFFASGRLRPMHDDQGNLVGFVKVCQDITLQHEAAQELAAARAKIAGTLEAERQRLAEIFQRSPSFMAVMRGDQHVFELANDEYFSMVGHRDIIGRSVREALPELEGQGVYELLDGVFTTGESYRATDLPVVLHRSPGGEPETHYVDFVYLPIRDAEQRVTGIMVHGIDQTHRRNAEQSLKTVAEQRRLALDAAGMGWWHLNVHTQQMTWDEKAGQIYGVDTESLSFEEALNLVCVEDRAAVQNAVNQALDAENPQPYFVEYRVQHADGSLHWVQSKGRAHFSSAPFRQATELVGTALDVTEIKLAQDALRQSEQRFRQMADAMPQIVFTARPDGHVDYFNAKWYDYTGFDPTADTGTGFEHWRQAHNEDGLRRSAIAWPEAIRTGNPYEIEYQLRRHDGEFRWHLARALPIRNDKGEVIRWIGTNTDIHDNKELQQENEKLLLSERAAREEAERANRIKDEFLATLSHELRTPLSAILGWCTILSNEPDPGDYANGLEIIERNARAQAQIIDDLLDMSAIISGKVRLHVTSTDLAPVVRTAVETLRPTAEAKGVRLQCILDPLARAISGDANRLQQIFWNLLSNAIKFTPKGGRVQVLLERVNSHLEVSVSDTGEGIPPEFLPLVFDRFRQADASITRRHGGLGLGLAIVKQLVELHGGSVRVKSVGLGFGSTFTVSLPLSAVHSEPPQEETQRQHPQSGSTPLPIPVHALNLDGVKVLVVDDEPDARSLICRLLADQKAVVSTASSVNGAMEQMEACVPDVLVSDIGMPGEDGYSLIRRVRALPSDKGGNVPAIALTAYARSEDRMRAIMAGFQMHIAKPAEAAELLAMIASLAGKMQPREGDAAMSP
jgi:PAS domain S-box-containing protein